MQSLDEKLNALVQTRSTCEYYAITLTADDNGKVVFGTQSEWIGWKDEARREEIRKARIVYSDFVKLWKNLKQPYSVIHSINEIDLFLLGGGNALVERSLADAIFPHLLDGSPSIPDGEVGFVSPKLLDTTAFRRAPTPKIRMQILKRDGRKCRICGRRPDDDVDIVLHVHHIRPWEKGGVTNSKNLITLCHTCHSGLAPHYDADLYNYLRPSDPLEVALKELQRGIANYRRVGFFSELQSPNDKKLVDEP